MTNEKVPYMQCLYHTGKKVYKYWVAVLAVIGVIIGLYFVISSTWKQIVDFATVIGNALGYIGYVLATSFNNVWLLACTIPWYLWLAAGVTIGPLILVAIWCALKHFNVDMFVFAITIISIAAICGLANMFIAVFSTHYPNNIIDIIIGAFSFFWLMAMGIVFFGDGNNDRGRYS